MIHEQQDPTVAAAFNTEIMSKVNSPATHIDIFYRGAEMSFAKADLPIKLGRDDSSCQIAVSTEVASRVHCTIEVRENQIGLADSSRNGTFIRLGRNDSFLIKGTFYPLIGQGTLRLGAPIEGDETDTIFFRMVSRPA
jgi:hypothetical protein